MPDKEPEVKQPPRGELAAVRSDINWFGINDAVNPDARVEQLGIEYFETEMELKDAHYRDCIRDRKSALLSLPTDVLPASDDDAHKEHAEFIKWNLKDLEGTFKQDLREIMDAISCGFAVSEIIWEPITEGPFVGKWRIKALHHKPPVNWRFRTDKYGTMLPKGFCSVEPDTSEEKPMPREKFVHYVFDSKYENPYGRGLGTTCSWYVWLKRNASKFWALYLEKYASPTTTCDVPRDEYPAKKADLEKIEEILQTMQQQTGILVPEGFKFAFLEAIRRGDVTYENFANWCDKQISLVVLSQTLTTDTDDKGGGSYALGKVHEGVEFRVIKADGEELEELVKEQIVKRSIDYNYLHVTEYPRWCFIWPRQTAEVTEKTLEYLGDTTLEIGENWVYEHFGIPRPDEDEKRLLSIPKIEGPPKPPVTDEEFTESPHARDVIEFTQAMGTQMEALVSLGGLALSKELTAARDSILSEIKRRKVLEKADPTIMDSISARLDTGKIAEPLENGIVMAGLTGWADGYTWMYRKGWRPRKKRFAERLRRLIFGESYRDASELFSPKLAYKLFSQRVPVSYSTYKNLAGAARNRAFGVAGMENTRLVELIKGHVLEALNNGWDFERFNSAVLGDPVIQDMAPIRKTSTAHLETVFRTNLMSAYNVSKWDFYNDPDVQDAIVAYEYIAILDSRVRPEHAAMDGKVYLKSDSIWSEWWPPNGFNCRCTVVAITRWDDLKLAGQIPVLEGKQVAPDKGFGGTVRGYALRGQAK